MMSLTDNSVFKIICDKVSLVNEFEKKGINLIPAGSSRYKCMCPFHGEKDASMFVFLDGDRPHYFCFSCKSSGDVIEFVKEFGKKTDINFGMKDALDYFAKNYGIGEIGKIDIRKLIDYIDGRKKSERTILPNFVASSLFIRDFLENSTNPHRDLFQLKNMLKNFEDIVFDKKKEEFEEYKNTIKNIISNFDMVKPEYNLERFCISCENCSLRKSCRQPIFGIGNIESKIFLIESGPNIDDDRKNRIYSDNFGKDTISFLSENDIFLNDFWLTYTHNCHSENSEEQYSQMPICIDNNLKKQILKGRPDTIVVMGDVTKDGMFPKFKKKRIKEIVGKCINIDIYGKNTKIIFNYGRDYMTRKGDIDIKELNIFNRTLISAFKR